MQEYVEKGSGRFSRGWFCSCLDVISAHARQSFITNVLEDGLVSALIFFSFYIFVHLLRTPWLERKAEGPNHPPFRDGVLGVILLSLLVGGVALVGYELKQDWQSQIILFAPADIGGRKSAELIELQTCKDNLSTLNKPELEHSLRRRTIELADEFSEFVTSRKGSHPPYAYPDSTNPNPTPERQVQIAASQKYDRETQEIYNRRYRDKFLGIIREYRTKGVPVGWLETVADRGNWTWIEPGESWADSPQDQRYEFRSLAYRVDAYDQLVVIR